MNALSPAISPSGADQSARRRARRTGQIAALAACAMVGVGFAAVPLYQLFCQVTGFGGTTQRLTEGQMLAMTAGAPVAARPITVRFDANQRGVPWEFRPEKPTDTASVGVRDMAIYLARNDSAEPVTGMATYNVTPERAGKYFNKVQCFCFTEQTLQPGQEVRMPVLYMIDPAILDDPEARDIEEITLSYTFYPVDRAKKGG
jgi:cytochrome c oxidase assembly protein subunit 11